MWRTIADIFVPRVKMDVDKKGKSNKMDLNTFAHIHNDVISFVANATFCVRLLQF